MAQLPVELVEEILRVSAWDSAQLQKPWLCSIATTSRFVWKIVKPALYDTVLLTSVRMPRVFRCAGSGNFGLTRRLWCGSPHALRRAAQIALEFPGVRHFHGWHVLFFHLCAQHSASFLPTQATLMQDGNSAPWHHLQSFRHLTHLHLVLASYRTPTGPIGTLDGARALKFVLISALQYEENNTALTRTILPFFFACRTLERVVVRISRDPELCEHILVALQGYALFSWEEHLWACIERRAPDAQTTGPVTIEEDKWLEGRRIVVRD